MDLIVQSRLIICRESPCERNVIKYSNEMKANIQMKKISSEEELWNSVSDGKAFVLDFYTSWCGPCKRISPFVEELACQNSEIMFFKADGDEATDLLDFFEVRGFPTFLIGSAVNNEYNILERIVGADGDRLVSAIERLKQSSSITATTGSVVEATETIA